MLYKKNNRTLNLSHPFGVCVLFVVVLVGIMYQPYIIIPFGGCEGCDDYFHKKKSIVLSLSPKEKDIRTVSETHGRQQ